MTDRFALALAALTSVTWGLTGIFVRLLPSISPFTVTAGRLLIAAVVVLPLFLLSRRRQLGFITAIKNPTAYFLASLLAGYYLLATTGFQLAPVAEAALFLSTPPLFVLAIRAFSGDRPALPEMAGAVLAASGIAAILWPQINLAGAIAVDRLFGDMASLAAALLTAIYAFRFRQLAINGNAPDTAGVMMLTLSLGGVAMTTVLALTFTSTGLSQLDRAGALTFLGLGLVSTAIPTAAFAIVSKQLPPIITATISLFIPLFAGLFAFLILGEHLPLRFLLGALLVLGGVVLIIRRPNER